MAREQRIVEGIERGMGGISPGRGLAVEHLWTSGALDRDFKGPAAANGPNRGDAEAGGLRAPEPAFHPWRQDGMASMASVPLAGDDQDARDPCRSVTGQARSEAPHRGLEGAPMEVNLMPWGPVAALFTAPTARTTIPAPKTWLTGQLLEVLELRSSSTGSHGSVSHLEYRLR